jgi:hypothetical protein
MEGTMKKMIWAAMLVLLTVSAAHALDMQLRIPTPGKIFDAVTVDNGTCEVQAESFDLRSDQGTYSLQCEVTGDGTMKFEARMSNDGLTWLEPEGQDDIAASITKTSGPGSDGKFINQIAPELGRWMKIYACETGATDNATVTCWMARR